MTVAAIPDQTALNNYKISIQARPASPMLSEKVASTGKLLVLQNDQQGKEAPTAESEAAEIAKVIDAYVKAYQTAELDERVARVEQLSDADLMRIAMCVHQLDVTPTVPKSLIFNSR